MLLGQGLHDLGRATFREISLVSRQVLRLGGGGISVFIGGSQEGIEFTRGSLGV